MSHKPYYEMIIANGGGLINTGDYLGVMIGPASVLNEFRIREYVSGYKNDAFGNPDFERPIMRTENTTAVPRGWAFIPIEIATVELIEQAVAHMKQGRDKIFPKKQTQGRKTDNQLLAEVFDSQDYIGN